MSLRTLLVPITGQPADEFVLDAAFSLGESFNSHISVLCVRPDPTDVVRYAVEWSYPILMDEAVATAERHSIGQGHKAAALYERWRLNHHLPVAAERAEVPGTTTSLMEHVGMGGDALRDYSRFADLVLMRSLGAKGPIEGEGMLEAALFDVGRPVLLIPGKPVDTLSGTALIAWDGGREAMHAVIAALPLLARMGTVRILTIDSDASTKAQELVVYLGWHGITATLHEVARGAASVGDAVLHEAHQIEAGLLVMGGYHHSRTREMLFGGTTRHVMSAGKIPVLLAH